MCYVTLETGGGGGGINYVALLGVGEVNKLCDITGSGE